MLSIHFALAFVVLGDALTIPIPNAYAPKPAICPSTALVRPANGISQGETDFVKSRNAKASVALASWLKKVDATFDTTKVPVVGLASSGGGLRALLSGAGVYQALDSRDSSAPTSGLLQGLTYQAGLSGGAWLLSSIAGNNYATISNLTNSLWIKSFQVGLLNADALVLNNGVLLPIETDIAAKKAAGFSPTLTDPWGRLLSYELLFGADGGVADTLSGITGLSEFKAFNQPYPILTSVSSKPEKSDFTPASNAPQYELTPYEFGSFDSGIKAFTQTKYLGSSLTNGKPNSIISCTTNYDNLGYALGTSSNVFNAVPAGVESVVDGLAGGPLDKLSSLIDDDLDNAPKRDFYAAYRNPFYEYPGSPLVQGDQELLLADGAETGQNNPIWPFLQPSRTVDALVVSDNSADTSDNFPDGSQVRNTYLAAQGAGLTRMPEIPPSATFVAQGLNKRATFFGCNDASKLTIVYLPNAQYSFDSGQSTFKLNYQPDETRGMIVNGNQIATQNGQAGFAGCLGCALQKKTGTKLPAACAACFSKYCYN